MGENAAMFSLALLAEKLGGEVGWWRWWPGPGLRGGSFGWMTGDRIGWPGRGWAEDVGGGIARSLAGIAGLCCSLDFLELWLRASLALLHKSQWSGRVRSAEVD